MSLLADEPKGCTQWHSAWTVQSASATPVQSDCMGSRDRSGQQEGGQNATISPLAFRDFLQNLNSSPFLSPAPIPTVCELGARCSNPWHLAFSIKPVTVLSPRANKTYLVEKQCSVSVHSCHWDAGRGEEKGEEHQTFSSLTAYWNNQAI